MRKVVFCQEHPTDGNAKPATAAGVFGGYDSARMFDGKRYKFDWRRDFNFVYRMKFGSILYTVRIEIQKLCDLCASRVKLL